MAPGTPENRLNRLLAFVRFIDSPCEPGVFTVYFTSAGIGMIRMNAVSGMDPVVRMVMYGKITKTWGQDN